MNKSLKQLNEGDTVLLYRKSILEPAREVKVEKVTRDRVKIGDVYFDRNKGYACGHGQDSHPPVVYVPTPKAPVPPVEDVQGKVVIQTRKIAKVVDTLQSLIPAKEDM